MKTSHYRIDSGIVGNAFNAVAKYPEITIFYKSNNYSTTGVHYLIKSSGGKLPKREDVVKSFRG